MKRSNGAGSVHKLSGNRRKPWAARIVLGRDDGTFIRKYIGYFEKKSEAELAIAMYYAMPTSDDQHITLERLFEKWKATRAYTELSKGTQANYNAAYKYFAEFHKTQFVKLRSANWQKAVDLADAKGLSNSTMTKIKALAGILSEYALAEDIVSKTYYKTVRVPRQSGRKEIPTFTDLEIAKLFRHASDPLVDTILILIYTGMRISELLGLVKTNVDIESMLIVGGVKTEAGRDRTIPIHQKIQPIILRRYADGEKYLIEYLKEIGNKKKGTKRTIRVRYRYEYYCDEYYEILERLGIRRLTPHKARHTFFTRMSERCKDKKAMAMIGGHSDPNFTSKVYDQPDIDRLRKAMECL
ncbi:tyrosine-type recombinase/integrase [Eubacteriales bacterium OttesenSCG-928-A19]|nr:tyrosine-type recombinase/integrase [Eubacteriales bacterium OttesenSCG-928-A19]